MARCQAQPFGRDEIDEGVVQRRDRLMHGLHDLFVLVWAGDGQHTGVGLEDAIPLNAEAARHDHAAVFGQRFSDGRKAFLFGRVEKTAGIDHHDIGAGVVRR